MTILDYAAGLFTPYYIALMAISTLGGIIVGLLPGITVTMSVGLLVGLTFGMPPLDALIVLTCVFVGGINRPFLSMCQAAPQRRRPRLKAI